MSDTAEQFFSLGPWIRRRRKALDLTQVALAHRVGCAEVTIRKIEADLLRPSRAIAERLARCLEIPQADREGFFQVVSGERHVTRLAPPITGVDRPAPPGAVDEPPVACLPIDVIPDPGPLPPGSYMPLRRNPLFVGREHDLRQLARVLNSGTAAISQLEVAAVTGLGGVGKTQLACEFVHRYGQFFRGGVFWLSFADPAAIRVEVAACGGVDGMQLSAEFGSLPLDEQVRQVRRAWKRPIPRLLVFDNCEDAALLDQWQPQHGGCRVLITSRRHHWDPALGVHSVPLDVLPRRESIALLRTFRADLPSADADLEAIADTLGDLPLALYLAGSFLARYRHALTPAHYLQRLRTPTILDDHSLREAGLSPTRHVQHVARTFEQSYVRLDPTDATDALARTLLVRAACFAPGEPIPRWLLLHTLSPSDDPDAALRAEDAVNRLIDLGLLETNHADALRLHRLLVAFVRTVAVDAEAQPAVESTMLQIADCLNRAGDPWSLMALQQHLRFITDSTQHQNAQAAGLYSALGMHIRLLGNYAEARRYVEQALAIQQQLCGTDHPDTARGLSNLGVVLWRQGEYAEAQRRLEQALAIQERVLGLEHPDTAQSVYTLGGVLWFQGRYAEARRYAEQAVAIQRLVLGAEHPATARSLSSLGVVMESLGEYAEAQRYLEQALAIQEQILGAEHPDTAQTMVSLGVVLCAQQEYASASRFLQQALAIHERVLGAEHPGTALSLMSLGSLLYAQGRYAEARSYHEQALAMRERVLGSEHPDTATTLYWLGLALQQQVDVPAARDCLVRSLAIFARRLGANHPATKAAQAALDDLEQTNR
ncbi:MAG TPA: tetratricopeptide repeat protein [Herpetosiphonaceae bacterium]